MNKLGGRLRSLRWRLTIFYGALLTGLVLALGLFIYTQLDQYLTEAVKTRLNDRASLLRTEVGPAPGSPRANNEDTPLDLSRISGRINQDGNASDVSVLFLDTAGQPIPLPNGNLPPLDPALRAPLPTSQQLKAAPLIYTSQIVSGTNRLLVLVQPVYPNPVQNGPPGQGQGQGRPNPNPPANRPLLGYFLLAASLQPNDALLGQLRFLLGIGLVVSLALVAALGFLVARLGLRPLTRMTQTARQIGAGEWQRRVPLDKNVAPDEIGQLTLAFNAMLDEIEAAFAARAASEARTRQFVADASHELRSPLTVLTGYLDVLLMGAKDEPEQAERIIRSMRKEMSRLSRLVVDLLQITRLDNQGAASLRLETVDLVAMARQVMANLQVVAGERQLILEAQPSVKLPGDSDALYRVLTNLLDNAIRYTEADGQIKVKIREEDGSAVTMSVADNGSGIDPAQLPHIFDRFYRADESRNRRTGNAGLGLAMVKAIVEAHGGTIEVQSQKGRGTRFMIRIPRPVGTLPPASGEITGAESRTKDAAVLAADPTG